MIMILILIMQEIGNFLVLRIQLEKKYFPEVVIKWIGYFMHHGIEYRIR